MYTELWRPLLSHWRIPQKLLKNLSGAGLENTCVCVRGAWTLLRFHTMALVVKGPEVSSWLSGRPCACLQPPPLLKTSSRCGGGLGGCPIGMWSGGNRESLIDRDFSPAYWTRDKHWRTSVLWYGEPVWQRGLSVGPGQIHIQP